MLNNELPAGSPGGPVSVPALDDLPERVRVHALAKRLARTSREVLDKLAELGVEARSPQSSVERTVAEQIVAALATASGPQPAAADEPEGTEPAVPEPAAPLAPLFAAPTPLFQAPTRPVRAAAPPEPAKDDEPDEAAPVESESDATDDDVDGDGDGETPTRRRRRRGRRGRGRGRGGEGGDGIGADGDADDAETGDTDDDGETDEDTGGEAAADDTAGGEDSGDEDGAGGSRRRRRRRRRRAGSDSGEDGDDNDPPNTVTKVRTPREQRDDEGDGVQGVRGSTRLEAKRQRRRDGRDAGRRRVPILSEAEFLARRESVERSMVVRERGDRVEIAVLEDDVLVEHFVNSTGSGRDGAGKSLVGNIYLGRVQNVLPSMEAAFVDIGRGRNAVLYAGEVDWDAAGLGGKQRRIEQALSSGDSVLVQVTKDPIGHKGARLTTQISLAGRFLVYVPGGGAAGISRKLPDVERKRLKDMLKEIVPSEAGVIIRTASEGVSHEALERDVRRLQAQWEVVKGKSESSGSGRSSAPTLLYEEPDLLIKVVRDLFNEDFSRLVVEGDEAWETVSNYVGHVAPELSERLHRHVGPRDVFAEYHIDDQLLKALDRKVWLPSGGTLVIDRTEAMTVIDVNTGKFTGSGGNLEETVTRNNLEAAEEIVRQLRLRDIGGIIVIDFIDMVLEANRDLVLRRLTECLARDRTRHQVAEVTSLGLVQMTRKRVGGGLLEHFSTPCEHCRGRGVIVNTEPAPETGGSAATGTGNGNGGGREGRRGRNRARRDGEDRNGQDTRKSEPTARNGHGPELVAAASATVTASAVAVDAPERPDAPEDRPAAEPAPQHADAGEDERPTGRRVRRSARRAAGAPTTAPPAAAEVVTVPAAPVTPAPAEPPAEAPADRNGTAAPTVPGDQANSDRRPRRRGRVTRTAGSPTAAGGEAPTAAVLTVPVAPRGDAADEVTTPAPVAPTARPRRARRAASRPAGPPTGEADPE